jgi:hypothetical protein
VADYQNLPVSIPLKNTIYNTKSLRSRLVSINVISMSLVVSSSSQSSSLSPFGGGGSAVADYQNLPVSIPLKNTIERLYPQEVMEFLLLLTVITFLL